MKRTVITALLLASFGVVHAASPHMYAADSHEHPTLTVAVDGQNVNSFRLIHAADRTGSRAASTGPRQGTTGPVQVLPAETLQSVVIDVPTGFVFVYVIDEGWRFVGNVAGTVH
jgi:hypothetical protein